MSRNYEPRMAARITIPTFSTIDVDVALAGSETTTLELRPLKCRWVKNDYTQADELELTLVFKDTQLLDPRVILNATVEFWLDDQYPSRPLVKTLANRRFTGVVTQCELVATESNGFRVELKCLDYATLLIGMPVTSPECFPTVNETIEEAWRRIQANVGFHDVEAGVIQSSIAQIPLVLRGNVDPTRKLGDALNGLFGILGANQMHHKSQNVMQIWQTFVNALGYLAFIDQNTMVVQDAESLYKSHATARLLWGNNVLSMSQKTDCTASSKGIVLVAFDPISGTHLESFYPPITNIYSIKGRRTRAADKIAPPTTDYNIQYIDFCHDQAALDVLARLAYLEWQRQTLTGKLTTHEMRVDTVTGDSVSVLDLIPGDAIQCKISKLDQEALMRIDGFNARKEYLLERGYTDEVATLLVRSADAVRGLTAEYHVSSMTIELDGEGPTYSCEIAYHNLVDLSGHAKVGTPQLNKQ